MSSGIVPIIDFAPFLTGDQASKEAVAKELHAAATEVGFFMIKGYQSAISQETVEQAFKQVSDD
jgi:isopenicillin N synthase-like dioxygenase